MASSKKDSIAGLVSPEAAEAAIAEAAVAEALKEQAAGIEPQTSNSLTAPPRPATTVHGDVTALALADFSMILGARRYEAKRGAMIKMDPCHIAEFPHLVRYVDTSEP